MFLNRIRIIVYYCENLFVERVTSQFDNIVEIALTVQVCKQCLHNGIIFRLADYLLYCTVVNKQKIAIQYLGRSVDIFVDRTEQGK